MTASHALSPSANKPVRLSTLFKEKIWGSQNLAPWFDAAGRNVGEVWFEADLPILIKFIFTTERLSVQVHPEDDFAARHEKSRGKTEMWHILRAEPGAQIALGFREPAPADVLREAAVSGEIERLLRWVDVGPGQTYFVPAGTVHAIGAGVALCEIQQNSDVTYRLYDYGRPRELHLEKGLAVTNADAHDGCAVELPVECEYFHTELTWVESAVEVNPGPAQFEVFVVLEGEGLIAGERYRLGEAWLAPAGVGMFRLEPAVVSRMLRCWVP